MTCEDLSPQLIAYHFATLGAAEREAVEEHLLSCPSCCRSFVLVKRSIEAPRHGPRPSPRAAERLRNAVADELIRRERKAARGWWERPLVLGFAAAAVAMAMVTTRALAQSPPHAPRSLPSHEGSR